MTAAPGTVHVIGTQALLRALQPYARVRARRLKRPLPAWATAEIESMAMNKRNDGRQIARLANRIGCRHDSVIQLISEARRLRISKA